MKLPHEIEDLGSFLERQGFALLRKEGPDPRFFGNMLIEYGNNRMTVQIDLDRSTWVIAVADIARPNNRYSVYLLRDLVSGRGSDDLSLAEEVGIVKAIWQEVMIAFSPSRREETHARLSRLGYEFDKRWLPSWPDAALELESFLSKRGLIRQRRDAPEGVFGPRLMQYADAVIGVRITCGGPLSPGGGRMIVRDVDQIGAANWALVPGGWSVEVADSTRLDRWYDVAIIRSMLDQTVALFGPRDLVFWIWAAIRQSFLSAGRFVTAIQDPTYWIGVLANRGKDRNSNDREMYYPEQFQFVKANWGLIRHLFCDRRREDTHARLTRLIMDDAKQ